MIHIVPPPMATERAVLALAAQSVCVSGLLWPRARLADYFDRLRISRFGQGIGAALRVIAQGRVWVARAGRDD